MKCRASVCNVRTSTRESLRAECDERLEIRGDVSGGKIGETVARYDAERNVSTSRK